MIKSTAKILKAGGEHLPWLGVTLRYFAIYFKETVGLGVKKHLDYLAGLGLTL